MLKLPVPGDCYVAGRTVAQIAQDPRFPTSSLIIGYQCHACANLEIPNGNTVLEVGSTITRPELVHPMIDYLGIHARLAEKTKTQERKRRGVAPWLRKISTELRSKPRLLGNEERMHLKQSAIAPLAPKEGI